MAGTYCGLTIRSDSLYCPLPFGLDTYYGCAFDCVYCSFLGLHYTWGRGEMDRTLDLDWFRKRVLNGVRTPGRTPLARAIAGRKTIRLGNKYDPLPPQESELRITRDVLQFLFDLGWEVKLESKNADLIREYAPLLVDGQAIVTTTVTIGLDRDWRELEGCRTPSPTARLSALSELAQAGLQVAVITEPFIPGRHTIDGWRLFLSLLSHHNINRVNTYNLQLTPFNARRLAEIGVDVVAAHEGGKDPAWRDTLQALLSIGSEMGFHVGCPDFVNAGRVRPTTNTCCGVDVQNPCTFNFINWRATGLDRGEVKPADVVRTWDGVGNLEAGLKTFSGKNGATHYSLADTGIFEKVGTEWKLT